MYIHPANPGIFPKWKIINSQRNWQHEDGEFLNPEKIKFQIQKYSDTLWTGSYIYITQVTWIYDYLGIATVSYKTNDTIYISLNGAKTILAHIVYIVQVL